MGNCITASAEDRPSKKRIDPLQAYSSKALDAKHNKPSKRNTVSNRHTKKNAMSDFSNNWAQKRAKQSQKSQTGQKSQMRKRTSRLSRSSITEPGVETITEESSGMNWNPFAGESKEEAEARRALEESKRASICSFLPEDVQKRASTVSTTHCMSAPRTDTMIRGRHSTIGFGNPGPTRKWSVSQNQSCVDRERSTAGVKNTLGDQKPSEAINVFILDLMEQNPNHVRKVSVMRARHSVTE
jgi:hypothetical protein